MDIRNVMIKAHSNQIKLGCDRELVTDSSDVGVVEMNGGG